MPPTESEARTLSTTEIASDRGCATHAPSAVDATHDPPAAAVASSGCHAANTWGSSTRGQPRRTASKVASISGGGARRQAGGKRPTGRAATPTAPGAGPPTRRRPRAARAAVGGEGRVAESDGARGRVAVDPEERLVAREQRAAFAREHEQVPLAARARFAVKLERRRAARRPRRRAAADGAARRRLAPKEARADGARDRAAAAAAAAAASDEALSTHVAGAGTVELQLHAGAGAVGDAEDGGGLAGLLEAHPRAQREAALRRERDDALRRQVEARRAHHADAHVPVRRRRRRRLRAEARDRAEGSRSSRARAPRARLPARRGRSPPRAPAARRGTSACRAP